MVNRIINLTHNLGPPHPGVIALQQFCTNRRTNIWISFPVCNRPLVSPTSSFRTFFNVLKLFTPCFYIHLWPSPKRPIRKWDVKVIRRGAIPKQRQRHRLILCPIDGGLVHAIKHHINIWNPPRVSPKELQKPPNREH